MGKFAELYEKIIHGYVDSNIRVTDLCHLLKLLGFDERIKGDHHIFTMAGVTEILNIQPNASKTKNYQVKQVRKIFFQYHLRLEGNNAE